jgi:chitodextrinase
MINSHILRRSLMNIQNRLAGLRKQIGRKLGLVIAAALVVNSGAGIAWAVPSNSGLVAHWSFDQTSGTTLIDNSGNGRNATLYKTPTWTAGKFNNSLKFDGTDYAGLGNISAINGVNQLTLATWMKRSAANAKVLVGKQTTNQDVAIEAWSDGTISFQLSKGTDTYGTINLNDTAWHHVVLVFDGTLSGNANRLKAYVDGTQRTLSFNGTVPTTTTTSTTAFNIGKIQGAYSNGQVDDTWLYTRALNLAEVQDLMAGGTPADTTAPTVPTGLGATAVTQNRIDLSWTASTDDTAVAGYRVYRDGAERTTTTATVFQDTGLSPSTTYTYTVRAYDAAGNLSTESTSATATTPAPAPVPTVALTATPTEVASGGTSTLNWTSTDADSCTATNGWNGIKATSGSQAINDITANTTYTLTCTGSGGQATTSVSVTVLPKCSDGVDNDDDNLVDGNDPGCSSATDNDETDPDTAAPTVSLTAPVDGATVNGNVILNADANDSVGVAGVKFYANGTQIGSEDTAAPYSATWDSKTIANGSVQLKAVARDAAGNTTDSSVVTVTVDNPVVTTKFVAGVSTNGRYFVDQTGAPYLVKADAPWSMFCNLSPSEVELWAANRESHGFNSAIVSLIGHPTNGCPSASGATYDGVQPFVSGNITNWNETYWSRIDNYMNILKNHGISVILYPMDGWNTLSGGAFAGKSNADVYAYGQKVAQRFANYPNIIWNVGGDYNGYSSTINAQFTNLLNGIRSAGDTRLFSAQFNNESLSTDISSYDSVVDWNFVYTYTTTYQKVLRGYNLTGTNDPRPSLFSEGNYEGEDWYGGLPTTDETLRRQQLWALTSGSPGEIMGTSDWQFNTGWQTRLDSTWIQQASKNRAWFKSLMGWQLLVPDGATGATQIVTAGRGTKITTDQSLDVRANDYVTAAQTPDHSLTVVYVPTAVNNTNARTITLNLAALPAGYTASWVDPTNATQSQPAVIDGSGNVTTPALHSDNTRDWLLVIKQN